MKLVEARKHARYSQEAVAKMLGITRPTYAKMEHYQDKVTIAEAKKLAELFGVDVSEIFFAENYN
jgi:DNA-binding XRE family transcriptional regulator